MNTLLKAILFSVFMLIHPAQALWQNGYVMVNPGAERAAYTAAIALACGTGAYLVYKYKANETTKKRYPALQWLCSLGTAAGSGAFAFWLLGKYSPESWCHLAIQNAIKTHHWAGQFVSKAPANIDVRCYIVPSFIAFDCPLASAEKAYRGLLTGTLENQHLVRALENFCSLPHVANNHASTYPAAITYVQNWHGPLDADTLAYIQITNTFLATGITNALTTFNNHPQLRADLNAERTLLQQRELDAQHLELKRERLATERSRTGAKWAQVAEDHRHHRLQEQK